MGLLGWLRGRRTREEWLAGARILRHLGGAPAPEAVQWISTSACDLSCPHCYSRAGKRDAGELSTEEARRFLIDELARMGAPTLVVAGGEAGLRRDLADVVSHALRRGVPWALHTHGGHPERLREAARAHMPRMVAVSLDGPPAYHDRFRGREGAFARALESIRMLKREGCPEVVAGTTVHRGNADLLADLLPHVLTSGADGWGLHLVAPEGRAHGRADLLPTPRQMRRATAFARRVRGFFPAEVDNEWGGAGSSDPFYRDTPFACGAGRFSCVVAAGGGVVPCTTTDPAESAGNVRETPLSEIWRRGFAPFREAGAARPSDPVRADAHDCWLQTRHGRSCRAAAFRLDILSGVA